MAEKEIVIKTTGIGTTVLLVLILVGILAIGFILITSEPACVKGKLVRGESVVIDCCSSGSYECNCDLVWQPVCAEDGQTYINPTAAKLANVNILYYGICKNKTETCYDSDGGKNYKVFGYVVKGNEKRKDICKGGTLVEYYCDNNEIKYVVVKCECEEGVCKENECKDTDGGDNPSVPGRVTFNDRIYEDFCLTQGFVQTHVQKPSLVEYYCENNVVKNKTYTCEYGCEKGRCLPKTCSDTDGGINEFVRGTVEVNGKEYTDYCVYPQTLTHVAYPYVVEYYCKNGNVANTTITCKDGCKDGACLEG